MKNIVTIVGLLLTVQFLGAGSCGNTAAPAVTSGVKQNQVGPATPATPAVAPQAGDTGKTADGKDGQGKTAALPAPAAVASNWTPLYVGLGVTALEGLTAGGFYKFGNARFTAGIANNYVRAGAIAIPVVATVVTYLMGWGASAPALVTPPASATPAATPAAKN